MMFEKKSKYDKIWVGVAGGLIAAVSVTLIIIYANSQDYTVADHLKFLFGNDEISAILRSRVLLSLKGGAIGIMPLFYIFLKKNRYNAVKGLIGVAAFIFLIIVAGALL